MTGDVIKDAAYYERLIAAARNDPLIREINDGALPLSPEVLDQLIALFRGRTTRPER